MGFPMKQVHVAGQPALNAEPIYSYGQWLQRCDDRRGSLMGLKKKNINSHSGLHPAVLGQGCWALKHIAYCSAQMLIKSKWSWRLQATSFFTKIHYINGKNKQTNQPTTKHHTKYTKTVLQLCPRKWSLLICHGSRQKSHWLQWQKFTLWSHSDIFTSVSVSSPGWRTNSGIALLWLAFDFWFACTIVNESDFLLTFKSVQLSSS